MNSSFGGDNFNTTSAGATTAPGDQKAEGICPVLIKQVKDSVEGNFQMWGMTFGMVSLVAIVREIETSSTKITYLMEDHTGQIEAHYWLEEGDTLKAPDVMVNTYAQLYGTVRAIMGKKTLMIFKLKPVKDVNELNTHILEVLNARFKSEEYSKKGAGFSDFSMNSNSANSGGFSVQQNAGNHLGLEGKQLAVYQSIKNHATEEGIDRQTLEKKFSHISKTELSGILDYMVSEGHVYTSIDPDHFLSTDG